MKFKTKLLNFFFPKFCLSCSKLNSYFCQECFSRVVIEKPTCFICQSRNNDGSLCSFCLYKAGDNNKFFYVDKINWLSLYKNQSLKNLMFFYKYAGLKEIAKIFATLLFLKIRQTNDLKDSILVPMAISNLSLKNRTYNQTELITLYLSSYLNMKMINGLKIKKFYKKQSDKKAKDRYKNVNQFIWLENDLRDKNIILIDDIITSGATLNSAAYSLKKANAKSISAFVVLKA